jgi:hypothetical protein
MVSGCAAATAANDAGNSGQHAADCTTGQLKLRIGPFIEPLSQQHVLALTLTNTSGSSCELRGYPAVTLRTAKGAALAVRYRDAGDEMLTSRRPVTVRLTPGARAYLAVNQFSCNAPAPGLAGRIDVRLPGVRGRLAIRLDHYPYLSSCGRGDPGRFIDVAPIEHSARALLHY